MATTVWGGNVHLTCAVFFFLHFFFLCFFFFSRYIPFTFSAMGLGVGVGLGPNKRRG